LIKKILIANRGEIAVRIIRACKESGIKSVAVYSEADKTSLHTRLADESYYIGSAPSSESYLNKQKIIDTAKKAGADAIHPGYGFFSENADFIKMVEDSGLIFIGPSSASVALMGSKTAARQRMQKNNVPIVPGTTKAITSVEEGIKIAGEITFPVLLKASAGGGGKGMRRINSPEEFQSAFESTQREALKAFGDDSIYIEKFIETPKHIEVQVIADKHGNYAHLFERECSIQRRHQKIIEEAPSSFVDPETREKITTAAVNAAKACNYYNAGTVEFLMDRDKSFYFLEMNTRLQVEHPVTELISGIDLVKEQISIAEGKKLSFKQEDLKINGHAMESRIYAEDPDNSFLPSTGRLDEYLSPSGPGVRVDGGFERGSEISIYYDPLIAKLVCWANDRDNAIERMKRALSEYKIFGVTSNISFLKEIFSHPKFVSGDFDINFLEKEFRFSSEQDEEIIKAISVFTAWLKNRNSASNNGSAARFSNGNNWIEQLND
jgi:acetyl-CoA carboxylase biotin carboxylase subunit